MTFDDGYADNLYAAKPLLEAADVPATVFIVSGAIGQAREFWWDELARTLLGPAPVPTMFAVPVDGETLTWRLDEAPYTEADHERFADWTAGHGDDPSCGTACSVRFTRRWGRYVRRAREALSMLVAGRDVRLAGVGELSRSRSCTCWRTGGSSRSGRTR